MEKRRLERKLAFIKNSKIAKQLEDEELFREDRKSMVSERIVKSVDKMRTRKHNEIKDRDSVNEFCSSDLYRSESEQEIQRMYKSRSEVKIPASN